MKVPKSKHSKAYKQRPKAPTDKRKPDAMSMNMKATRDQYSAREIEQPAPSAVETKDNTRAKLKKVQGAYKPMKNGRVSPVG